MEANRECLAATGQDHLGIIEQKPKHPRYAVINKRLESFATWPADSCISATQLADCGFAYTGHGDSVRCFYCGGGLKNWGPEDDPWVEHASWYPACPHVRLVKGQDFINRIHNSSLESDEEVPTTENSPDPVAFQNCLKMGIPQNKILEAIGKYIDKHGHTNYKSEDLCQILHDDEEMTAAKSVSITDLPNCYGKNEADKADGDQSRAGEGTEKEVPDHSNYTSEDICQTLHDEEEMTAAKSVALTDLPNCYSKTNADKEDRDQCRAGAAIVEEIHGHSSHKREDLYQTLHDEEVMTAVKSIALTDVPNCHRETEADKADTDQCRAGEGTEEEISESFKELQEENRRLKDNLLCTICMDGIANIIFLPCGHRVTCPQCAPVFIQCPLCNVAVKGIVKAYFSD